MSTLKKTFTDSWTVTDLTVYYYHVMHEFQSESTLQNKNKNKKKRKRKNKKRKRKQRPVWLNGWVFVRTKWLWVQISLRLRICLKTQQLRSKFAGVNTRKRRPALTFWNPLCVMFTTSNWWKQPLKHASWKWLLRKFENLKRSKFWF